MAIRHVKKALETPPAHLYLEDIEEMVGIMTAANNKLQPERAASIWFVVGKKRECDSIEDLKKLNGRWRNFKMHVGYDSFATSIYDSSLNTMDDPTFNDLFRLMKTREVGFRAFLRKFPSWPVILWLNFWVFFAGYNTSNTRIYYALPVVIVSVVLIVWALSAHTIVELRYSHDKVSKFQTFQGWGSKAIWIVLGVLLAKAAGWLWEHFAKH
jgi:hypothetical protein